MIHIDYIYRLKNLMMMFSVMCHDFCHCVDEKEECDLPEGGKGGIQDTGWETYWGEEEEDIKTVQYSDSETFPHWTA